MEKETTALNCETCLRPINEAGSTPTSQWRSFCKCNRSYSPNTQFSIDVCANCKKRVATRHDHKMESVFLCSCEKPTPKKIPNFQKLRSEEEAVTLDLAGAGIAPETFPAERYTPLAILGRSARADVILARDRQTGNKVALKLFKRVASGSFAAFDQDTKKNKKLSHNFIARLFDAGIYENTAPYTVTEYKDGFNLEQCLALYDIPSHDVTVKILISLCEALIYAQKESLMHRDIRPGNIIFLDDMNSDPSVSITDFSLPKVKATEKLTEINDAIWLSADEARGLEFDERSEVYSIGCVGYALLTGRPPFQDGSVLDIKNAHGLKLPPKISSIKFEPQRPGDLEEVVERCLEKDPRQRFDTVAKLLERLEVFPRREKMQIAAVLAAKQRKKLLAIVGACLIVLILSTIGYFALGRH